jgi:tRNA-binding EMAP/Myf-like protein
MRVPLSWLRDYVDFEWSAEELARRLTVLGMEVQSIEHIGGDWQRVVVGELLEVKPHPRSDRLSLTVVRVADDAPTLAIVCGATNIAAGQRVPVALPGAVLPGGREIGVSAIQGEQSQGMLCSGAELGLTDDADGILILDASAPIGAPLEDYVADAVLDVDVKPNRGDALSLIGLAREVAAITGGRVRWPEIVVPESGDLTADHIAVEVSDTNLCPRFVGRWVDDIKVGPSPLNVQLRLSAAGMRPVSNVVERLDRFAGVGTTHDDATAADDSRVERVDRLAQLEHHVVAHVDDIADRPLAGGDQAHLDPVRGGPDRDAADPAADETRTQLRRLDLDAQVVLDRVAVLDRIDRGIADRRSGHRGDFAREADEAQRVAAIGLDVHVEDDVAVDVG